MAQPSWALGFGDDVWWSRLAQPARRWWTDTDTMHKLQELTPPTDDPDPKALACYGLLVRLGPQQADQMWLRFVEGRPVSTITINFLAWCSAQLAARGLTAPLLIWDNASWHCSHAVRRFRAADGPRAPHRRPRRPRRWAAGYPATPGGPDSTTGRRDHPC
jgi:hypothetical protein